MRHARIVISDPATIIAGADALTYILKPFTMLLHNNSFK